MAQFFESAAHRIKNFQIPSDIHSLRRLFAQSKGIVVSSCHGVKGDEFEVVICFGLLHGYLPHWDAIIDKNINDEYEARKLLYVVASRAKTHLHLIAESGRVTRSNKDYEANRQLRALSYEYDSTILD